MTSVSARCEEKTASFTSLNYRVKAKTIINNEGNWGNVSLVAIVGSRKGFYFKSLNLKKLLLLKKINNRGNIIQLQKETAYLPPSCSLLRESGAVRSTLNCFYNCRHSRHEHVIFSFPTHDTEIKTLKIYHIPTYRHTVQNLVLLSKFFKVLVALSDRVFAPRNCMVFDNKVNSWLNFLI